MPSLPNPGADPTKLNFGNPPELNVAFAAEMEKLLAKYPTDLDVAAVYVEGVMNSPREITRDLRLAAAGRRCNKVMMMRAR